MIRVEFEAFVAPANAAGESTAIAARPDNETFQPRDADVVSQAAELVRAKDYAGALKILEAAAIQGESAGMLFNYYCGLCLNKLDRRLEALDYLERAAALNRGQAAVPELLGQVYYKLGRRAEAEQYFRQALKFNPASSRMRKALQQLSGGQDGERPV